MSVNIIVIVLMIYAIYDRHLDRAKKPKATGKVAMKKFKVKSNRL